MTFDVPPDDMPGDPNAAASLTGLSGGTSTDGICTNCNTRPLKPYGGRGRRPKLCVECDDIAKNSPNAPRRTAKPTTKSNNIDEMVERISMFYVNIAMGVQFVGATKDSQIIATHSDALAASWKGLLANPKVYKRWESFLESTSLMTMVGAHLSLVGALATAHGINPLSFLGIGKVDENA